MINETPARYTIAEQNEILKEIGKLKIFRLPMPFFDLGGVIFVYYRGKKAYMIITPEFAEMLGTGIQKIANEDNIKFMVNAPDYVSNSPYVTAKLLNPELMTYSKTELPVKPPSVPGGLDKNLENAILEHDLNVFKKFIKTILVPNYYIEKCIKARFDVAVKFLMEAKFSQNVTAILEQMLDYDEDSVFHSAVYLDNAGIFCKIFLTIYYRGYYHMADKFSNLMPEKYRPNILKYFAKKNELGAFKYLYTKFGSLDEEFINFVRKESTFAILKVLLDG